MRQGSQQRNGQAPGRVIVIGFDGSALSHMAVDYVSRRAAPDDVMVIVHACGGSPSYGCDAEDPGASELRRARGRAILETALSPTEPAPRARHVLELRDEQPVQALVTAAEEHDADQIVLGAAGVGRVSRGLGRVAGDVLERSARPVLVVPRAQSEAMIASYAA